MNALINPSINQCIKERNWHNAAFIEKYGAYTTILKLSELASASKWAGASRAKKEVRYWAIIGV